MANDVEEVWPLRTAVLAVAGGLTGLAIHLLAPDGVVFDQSAMPVWRVALATFLLAGGIAFGLTWERRRASWSLGFAALAGAVVAAVIGLNGAPGAWSGGVALRLPAAIVAVLISAPFFQVARIGWERNARPALPYPLLHRAAWDDAALLFSAGLFVLLVWALAWLLASLFDLIGLDVLKRLLQRGGAFWVVSGAATGAAFGLLKDRLAILTTLQRLAMLVLAVLAPVLAAGFVLFVASLPFTGLAPLWRATKATTPVMLAAAVVSLLCLNAINADRREDEARHPALRWAAVALALVMAPFAAIAAVSTGLRIGQHGLSPDRLWALVLDAVAAAYAVGMAGALVRGFGARWPERIRDANVRLGLGLCLLALLLSTPLVGFDALSARDQVARLRAGRVAPERFDWRALRFDFGPPGMASLEALARSGDVRLSVPARRALAAKGRFAIDAPALTAPPLARRLRTIPADMRLDPHLIDFIDKKRLCSGRGTCLVRVEPPDVLVAYGGTDAADDLPAVRLLRKGARGWSIVRTVVDFGYLNDMRDRRRLRDAIAAGTIEVRPVERRQVFAGGVPMGDAFP